MTSGAQISLLVDDILKKHDASFIQEKCGFFTLELLKEMALNAIKSKPSLFFKITRVFQKMYEHKSTKEEAEEDPELPILYAADRVPTAALNYSTSFLVPKEAICNFGLVCKSWFIATHHRIYLKHIDASLFFAVNQMNELLMCKIKKIETFRDLQSMKIDLSVSTKNPSIYRWFPELIKCSFKKLNSLTLKNVSDPNILSECQSYTLFATLSFLEIEGDAPNLLHIFQIIYHLPKLSGLVISGVKSSVFEAEKKDIQLKNVKNLTLAYVEPSLFEEILPYFTNLEEIEILTETYDLWNFATALRFFNALSSIEIEYCFIKIHIFHNDDVIVDSINSLPDVFAKKCPHVQVTLCFYEETENDYLKYIDPLEHFLNNKAGDWEVIFQNGEGILFEK